MMSENKEKSVIRQRVADASMLEYASENRAEGFFNDVTIVVGKKNIPANRLVLSCYSPYFETMFKSTLRERYENIIDIQSVDGTTMKSLIDFIYVGSVIISKENVMNLLSGADYLQLCQVKQFCFEFLRENLAPSNALTYLKAATLYRNDALKEEIQKYIGMNLSVVTPTNEFNELLKEFLISLVSITKRYSASESSIYEAIVTWTRHEQSREIEFPELFESVDLDKVTLDYLEEVVLEEKLVTNSFICQKRAMSTFHKLLKAKIAHESKYLVSLGGKNTACKVADVYNSTVAETSFPDLPHPIQKHMSLQLHDYVYCIGGETKKDDGKRAYTNKVYRMNVKTKHANWKEVAAMHKARRNFGAAVYFDTLVVAGGSDEIYNTSSCEFYSAALNEWKIIQPLNQCGAGNALVVCDDCLYALGGCVGGWSQSSVERLDDLKGEWCMIQAMQTPRYWFAAVNCNGSIYAIGGKEDQLIRLKSVEKYDPAECQWKYVSNMNIARSSHAACVMDNKIYVVGGFNNTNKVEQRIECYDPLQDTWTIVGNTRDILVNHSLVALKRD